jgi:hypothetical protein
MMRGFIGDGVTRVLSHKSANLRMGVNSNQKGALMHHQLAHFLNPAMMPRRAERFMVWYDVLVYYY